MVGDLAVRGEVEALALGLGGRPQPDDQVDDLVEDDAADAGPERA